LLPFNTYFILQVNCMFSETVLQPHCGNYGIKYADRRSKVVFSAHV